MFGTFVQVGDAAGLCCLRGTCKRVLHVGLPCDVLNTVPQKEQGGRCTPVGDLNPALMTARPPSAEAPANNVTPGLGKGHLIGLPMARTSPAQFSTPPPAGLFRSRGRV